MIIANMATFPPRIRSLEIALDSICNQFDQINLVLNNYSSIPEFLIKYNNLNTVIPEFDTKDTGKFLLPVGDNDIVFTVDDDIKYPYDYVEKTVSDLIKIDNRKVFVGYHGQIYKKPKIIRLSRRIRKIIGYKPNFIVQSHEVMYYFDALSESILVDSLGTGTVATFGRWMPPFSAVRTAQKFIDARIASLCFEADIDMVCLSRPKNWLQAIEHNQADSIYVTFTSKQCDIVADEIEKFAFKRPNVGNII